MAQLEIAVTSLEDALRAVEGGADSVELSQDLPNGGLTPPIEVASAILSAIKIPVHIIVRPHARSFIYSESEITEILYTAKPFAQMGATSIVFGAVTTENYLDISLIERVAKTVAPTPVTVHRALDGCADPESALKALVDIVPRVLTSGPALNAWDGREITREWVQQFGEHFQFVLSGSIGLEQLPELIRTTNAPVYHIGNAARTNDAVDSDKVKQLREVIR